MLKYHIHNRASEQPKKKVDVLYIIKLYHHNLAFKCTFNIITVAKLCFKCAKLPVRIMLLWIKHQMFEALYSYDIGCYSLKAHWIPKAASILWEYFVAFVIIKSYNRNPSTFHYCFLSIILYLRKTESWFQFTLQILWHDHTKSRKEQMNIGLEYSVR